MRPLPVIAAGRFTRYDKLNFFPLVLFETAPIRIPEAFGNSIGDAMPVENSMLYPIRNMTAYQREIW